jgi:hypothetical protein
MQSSGTQYVYHGGDNGPVDLSAYAEHYTDVEHSYGLVILDQTGRVLLFLNKNGKHWGFAKGHRNNGESGIQAAFREVEEETGITEELLTARGNSYSVSGPPEAKLDYVANVTQAQFNTHLRNQALIGDRPYWYKPGYTVRRIEFWSICVGNPSAISRAIRFDPEVFSQAVWVGPDTARALMASTASFHLDILEQILKPRGL